MLAKVLPGLVNIDGDNADTERECSSLVVIMYDFCAFLYYSVKSDDSI